MRVLLDENVALLVQEHLTASGHQVEHLASRSLKGLKNGEIYQLALQGFDLFITNDRDFLSPRTFPPTPQLGIIFLRVSMAKPQDQVSALQRLLDREPPERLRGQLTIVRTHDYEIRSR